MILGTKKLLELVKSNKILDGLSERELKNSEGAGFDLRIGEIFEASGYGFLGVDERCTPNAVSVAKYDPEKRQKFKLVPGKLYLVKTIENFNVPDNLMGFFHPRSTLCRSGIQLLVGEVDPGYSGGINVGLINLGGCDFEVELGARFMYVSFLEVKGGVVNKYRGQWQGGRTHATKKERQI